MSTVYEYHTYARDCLRWAARARTEEQRRQFLTLAHDWTQSALGLEPCKGATWHPSWTPTQIGGRSKPPRPLSCHLEPLQSAPLWPLRPAEADRYRDAHSVPSWLPACGPTGGR
jgi:hypothetical protein